MTEVEKTKDVNKEGDDEDEVDWAEMLEKMGVYDNKKGLVTKETNVEQQLTNENNNNNNTSASDTNITPEQSTDSKKLISIRDDGRQDGRQDGGQKESDKKEREDQQTEDERLKEEEKQVDLAEISLINKLLRSRLVQNKNDIEILRKDPKSPLYSVKSFDKLNLKEELLKGVYDMGFNAPSKIQESALPPLLANPPCNMIAQSQSGTGKTAAFVLTMLSRVDVNLPYTQCVCLAPTYELALQIGDVTMQMAKYMINLNVGFAIRGSYAARRQPVPFQIVIGTPGTTLDWCYKLNVLDLKKIKVFVLDEADVMIDKQGHREQSIRIKSGLRPDCQTLFFSATYDEQVIDFAKHIVSNPIIMRLKREEESLENIKQYYIQCSDENEKYAALCNIYGAISIGQCMIFCHTRRCAAWLTEHMTKDGHCVGLLSGELAVEQRAAIIKRFKEGKEKVLITTNVSARGIDVEQVTLVVNFDLPVDLLHRVDFETYLHRIGRTGRFGKSGLAINMVDSSSSMSMLKAIEAHFGRKIEKLDASDLDEIEKIGGKG